MEKFKKGYFYKTNILRFVIKTLSKIQKNNFIWNIKCLQLY